MEGGALMPEYRVEWSVEVEADGPEAAARLALAIEQSANRAMSGVFCVWGKNDPDHPILVDLFPERADPLTDPRGARRSRPIAGDLTCPKSR
jgi:hypothetical protein